MSRSGTLRCIPCDESLGRAPSGRVSVDRPFEECPRCGVVVPRPGAGEWDLLPAPRRLTWLADRMAPALAIGALPGLGVWALGLRSGREASVPSWTQQPFVVLGVGLFLGFFVGASRLRTRIQRSRARMNDPMYRARLAAFERRSIALENA